MPVLGRTAWQEVHDAILWMLIAVVRAYQATLSPLVGNQCRFWPTCSEYFIGSLEKHGLSRGAFMGGLRVLRCNPFFPGGYDPP